MKPDKTKFIETRTHCMDLKSDNKVVQSVDVSGSILDVSPAWLKMTGYRRDEVIGKHFVEFLALESLMQVQKNLPKIIDYGYVDKVQLNILSKDHVVIPVTLTGTSKYNDSGVFERTFCEITPVDNN